MAYQGSAIDNIVDGTRLPSTDLSGTSTALYKFVKLNSSGQVLLCTGVTDEPYGVLMNLPDTSTPAIVGRLGRFKIQGDADLTVGNKIGTSADGQAAAYVFGTDTTKYIVGTVIEDNAAAGGYITADINCINPPRGA